MRIPCTLMKLGQSKAVSSFLCVAALLLASVPQTKAAFSTPAPLVSTPTDTSDQQVATSGVECLPRLERRREWCRSIQFRYLFRPVPEWRRDLRSSAEHFSKSQCVANPRIAASGQHVYITFSDTGGDLSGPLRERRRVVLAKNQSDCSFRTPAWLFWLASSGGREPLHGLASEALTVPLWLALAITAPRFLARRMYRLPRIPIDPVVAASGNSVYVAWSEPVAGNSNDILFRRSTDGGVAFDAVKNVSNNTGLSRFPTMTADGTKVWLAWTDRTLGNDDILFAQIS